MIAARERDPAILARSRDLNWLAQRALRGAPFGRHPGRDLGPGIEFSQYRAYEPGDDARWLDWRRLARGQDPLIRLAPREARVNVSVVLDTSASMAEPSAHSDWTRLHCARGIAAVMLGIARRQGDAFHWLALSASAATNSDAAHLRLAHGDAHLAHCVAALSAQQATGPWPDPDAVRATLSQLPRTGLVIVISDFIAPGAAVNAFAQGVQSTQRDVIALQLLTRAEVAFSYSGNLDLVDRETGHRVRTHAESARRAYEEAFGSAQSTLRRAFRRRGIVFESALAEQSPLTIVRPLLGAYARAHAARRAL